MNIHSQKYTHSARTLYVRIIVMYIVDLYVRPYISIYIHIHLCIYILKKKRTLSAPNAHSICMYNRYVYSIFYAHSVCIIVMYILDVYVISYISIYMHVYVLLIYK